MHWAALIDCERPSSSMSESSMSRQHDEKVRAIYEFGGKVSITTTHKEEPVVGARSTSTIAT
jgi:hypothetical protein